MENVIIGIDLGGTRLRIGAVTPDNQVIEPFVTESAIVANAKNPVQKLCEFIAEYKANTHTEHVEAISIGVPSSVECDKETVICTTNIRNQAGEVVFFHTNLAKQIREYFQVPVFVNNDVNNILLYDIVANHLEKKKVVVGIYIGTGVGSSVVIDGKPLEGKNGAQLDLGHILEEMYLAAVAKKAVVSVMPLAGDCKRYEKNSIQKPQSVICLLYIEKKNL